MILRASLVLLAVLIAACGGADDDDVDLPMQIAGHHTLLGSQEDGDCYPPEVEYHDLYAFSELTPQDLPAFTLDITQQVGALEAVLGPADCGLGGSVGATGAVTLEGPCDDDLMDRMVRISADVTSTGSGGFSWDGAMVIEVDHGDGDGGAPDGTVDCTITRVALSGSGTADQL